MLFKKIFEQTKDQKSLGDDEITVPEPKWKCSSCNFEKKEWQITCENCSAFGQIIWSKVNLISTRTLIFLKNFYKILLDIFQR